MDTKGAFHLSELAGQTMVGPVNLIMREFLLKILMSFVHTNNLAV